MNIFENDTLYRKNEKGKYIPVGTSLQHDNLYNGLWLVMNNKHSKSITSVTYLLDKLRDYEFTIDDVTTILTYRNKIIDNVFKNFSGLPWSLNDVSESVLAEIINVIKKEHEDNDVQKRI